MKSNKTPSESQIVLPQWIEMPLLLVAFGMIIFGGLYCFSVGIGTLVGMIQRQAPIYAVLFILFTFLPLCIFMGVMCFSVVWGALHKYRYCSEGIIISYLLIGWFIKDKLIPWSAFQEACVCYTTYSTRGPTKVNTGIIFVPHGEKKNMKGRWKTESPLHFWKIPSFSYSPELLQELIAVCPLEIKDLRGKGNYRT